MQQYEDIRRRTAFVTQAAARIIVTVQAFLQDAEGAAQEGQFEVAAIAGRSVVLECVAIQGIARGGELTWPSGSVSFDAFAALDEHERERATSLMDRGARLTDKESARAWTAELAQFIRDVEIEAGFTEPLPVLRSPEGMFAAMRMARGAFEIVSAMDLAPVFPESWTMALPPKAPKE
jgi:hypothetical protein